ncbi:MAG TPA: C-type lectin domain-containing protein [Kofleriaceae bacterium]|nr:C-type lectin domain-containing protein [Kofleriaceae bacterium]
MPPDGPPDGAPDAPPLIDGCPPGYNIDLTGMGFSKYKVLSAMLTWRLGEEACEADGVGYTGKTHLATFGDDAERVAIDGESVPNNAWIGLTDLLNEGTFIWVNNEPNPAQSGNPWAGSNPDGGETADCVRLGSSSTYDDRDCTAVQASLCECDNKAAMGNRFP